MIMLYHMHYHREVHVFKPASVAQLDARPTGDQEVAGLTPVVEIAHEIFSMVILSLPLITKSSCQFLAKKCAQYWLNA